MSKINNGDHSGPIARFAEWLRNRVTSGDTRERAEALSRVQEELREHRERLSNIQDRQAVITGRRPKHEQL
jgi:hypothetical protein